MTRLVATIAVAFTTAILAILPAAEAPARSMFNPHAHLDTSRITDLRTEGA